MVGPYGGVVPPMPVPGMSGMKPGGGIPPVGHGNNAILAGAPSSLGAGAAVGGALPDKMNTLFIGSIAPGINKVAMEKLLRVSLFIIIIFSFYFAQCVISDILTVGFFVPLYFTHIDH